MVGHRKTSCFKVCVCMCESKAVVEIKKVLRHSPKFGGTREAKVRALDVLNTDQFSSKLLLRQETGFYQRKLKRCNLSTNKDFLWYW